MSRILCIDDEPAILRLLSVVLEADGHETVKATSSREALGIAARDDIAAVLLDLGLPDRNGLELISALQAVRPVPILVISARSDVSEKVTALDLGASDYITKPFDGEEVRARLRAALRQSARLHPSGGELHYGTIRMNPERHEAEIAGRQLSLSPKEYAVLLALVEASGRVLTHAALLERVWGKAHKDDVEYLRVAVRALRLKIEDDPSRPAIIRNEPGVGYRLI